MSATGRGDGSSFWEWIALWGLGIVAAASVGLWLVGGVASSASGRGWPEAGADAMPGILSRLPEHLADPGAAWPEGDPGRGMWPVAFYGVVLLGACLGLGGVFAFASARDRWRGRPRRDERGARWATGRDLAALVVPEPTPGRVNLGRQGRRLLAAEARQSVIVFGPTQTGKTTSLAVPAILEWQGPVVCTSVKTELLRDTVVARSAIPGGDVLVFDPTASTGLPRNTWTPIAGCCDWARAQRTAWWMAMATKGSGGGLADADFWFASAAKLLAPLLFAAAHIGADMAEVIQWIDEGEEQEVLATLDGIGHGAARRAFQAHVNREERTRSSIVTTLETALQAYADPVVLASATGAELDARRLVDGVWHTASS